MKIIGICGQARTGKDTVANYLVEQYDFKKLAFADSLKMACKEVFGFDFEQLYGETKEVKDEFWDSTPRELLQYVGTDMFRTMIRDDIWVKSLERKVLEYKGKFPIVISDCRFLNELEAIKSWGGEIWKLNRIDGPGARGGLVAHPSEVELTRIPDEVFNSVITAPTGVPGLLEMVEATLKDR